MLKPGWDSSQFLSFPENCLNSQKERPIRKRKNVDEPSDKRWRGETLRPISKSNQSDFKAQMIKHHVQMLYTGSPVLPSCKPGWHRICSALVTRGRWLREVGATL